MIAALCKAYGAANGSRFAQIDGEKCIMCGLCAGACAKLGTGAISTVLRGTAKKISTPYDEPSKDCVGCLSCAYICPTKAITFKDDGQTREVWGRTFEIVHCRECGAPVGTREEIALAARRAGEEPEELCPTCRKKKMTDIMAHTYGIV